LAVLDERMLTGSPAGAVVGVISTLIWGDARGDEPGSRHWLGGVQRHAAE